MYNYYYENNIYDRQKDEHTHEFLGSTMIGESSKHPHDHRMAGISGKAINVSGGHVHEIISNTSFDDNHFHKIGIRTGLQIPVGNNRHIHFANGTTTVDDGHNHNFQFSTLI